MSKVKWLKATVSAGSLWAAPACAALPAWPLPPVHYGTPSVRPMPAVPAYFDLASPHSHATPMLDQWIAEDDATPSTRHRRSAMIQLGGLNLSIEALRDRTLKRSPGPYGSGIANKLFSIGLDTGWTVGADTFWAGIASVRQSFAQPDAMSGRGHVTNTETVFGGGWQHGDHLRFNLDWRQVAGSISANGAERMAQLAAGAPLHEDGCRFALEWAPQGYGLSTGPRFGVEARSARLARDDADLLGTNRADTRIGLFLRTSFR